MGDVKEYPIRSTARKYHDMDGNEVTLSQLIRREPEWARNVMLSLEEKLTTLQDKLNAEAREHRLTNLALKQAQDSYKQADEAHTRIETQLTTLQAEKERLQHDIDLIAFELTGDEGEDDAITVLKRGIECLGGLTIVELTNERDELLDEKVRLEGELGRQKPIIEAAELYYLAMRACEKSGNDGADVNDVRDSLNSLLFCAALYFDRKQEPTNGLESDAK